MRISLLLNLSYHTLMIFLHLSFFGKIGIFLNFSRTTKSSVENLNMLYLLYLLYFCYTWYILAPTHIPKAYAMYGLELRFCKYKNE